MKTKKIAALSTSALAAGMAHGSIVYTYTNHTALAATPLADQVVTIDLNQDGSPDFSLAFSANNASKPYVSDAIGLSATSPTVSYVLSDPGASDGQLYGLPLTTFGTTIDSNYEALEANGYFYIDDNNNTIGSWGPENQGYVGLELFDGSGNNYYGWAQFVYNSTNVAQGITGTLTLVDYAMETTPGQGIAAGQTAEPGASPQLPYPPTAVTAAVGFNAQFSAHGTGNPIPTYQWSMSGPGGSVFTNLTDNGSISGSVSNTLTISNVTLANQGEQVEVGLTNAHGGLTSTAVTLTVVPLVLTGPAPSRAEFYSGGTARFAISSVSSVPVSYHWLKNGAPLTDGSRVSGSQTSILTISNVTGADDAGYSVIVTNVYGAVTSSVSPLTIDTPTSPYQQELKMLSPVVYYSLDETNDPATGTAVAYDPYSGLNGSYGNLVENGNATNAAIAGPQASDGFLGFSATNSAMWVGLPKSPASYVKIPPLNLNTNTVSFVLWFNPTNAGEPNWACLLSFRTAVSGTANGPNYTGNGTLGYHWNDNGNTYNFDSGIVPPNGQWSMYALTISPTAATVYLWNANGLSTAVNNFDHVVQPLNTPGSIGGDDSDPNFVGAIDEVAIFKQTLSFQQVSNLFQTAVTGQLYQNPTPVTMSIQVTGGNVSIGWTPVAGTLYEATSLNGPWTPDGTMSPFVEAVTGTQKFFKVSN